MKKQLMDSINSSYNIYFNKYGNDPRSLMCPKKRQKIRYQVLTEIGNLDNSSILDFGCGFGDLYKYLLQKKVKVAYTGYDINPNFIQIAREKHPNTNFVLGDIEENIPKQKYDWSFVSGTFNVKTPNHTKWVKIMIKKLFSISKKGFAVDFLSSYVDYKNKEAYYSNPNQIFEFSKTLTKRVVLRHDYMPYEFCLYLYKNDSINSKNIFADFYSNYLEKP